MPAGLKHQRSGRDQGERETIRILVLIWDLTNIRADLQDPTECDFSPLGLSS